MSLSKQHACLTPVQVLDELLSACLACVDAGLEGSTSADSGLSCTLELLLRQGPSTHSLLSLVHTHMPHALSRTHRQQHHLIARPDAQGDRVTSVLDTADRTVDRSLQAGGTLHQLQYALMLLSSLAPPDSTLGVSDAGRSAAGMLSAHRHLQVMFFVLARVLGAEAAWLQELHALAGSLQRLAAVAPDMHARLLQACGNLEEFAAAVIQAQGHVRSSVSLTAKLAR